MKIIYPEKLNVFRMFVTTPLSVITLFNITYKQNPLNQTKAKYVIFFVQFHWILLFLEIFGLSFINGLILNGIITSIYIIMSIVGLEKFTDELILEVFSVFSSIGWMKFFTRVILDQVSFISFYFSISEIVFNCVIQGMGNALVDVFCAVALTEKGRSMMGTLSLIAG